MTRNQEKEEDPLHQQQQSPNLARSQQHSPQSPTTPATLEPDPEHPRNSDPDDRIEVNPDDDDDDDVVEMISVIPDQPKLCAAGGEQEKGILFGKEELGIAVVENFIKFDGNQTEEENGVLFFDGKNVGENDHFMRRCTLAIGGDFESMDFEEQKHKQEVEQVEEDEEEEVEEEEEEEEEEETEQEAAFALPMLGETANHLFQGMEVSFSSFMASTVDTNTIRAGPSHFEHENGFLHHSVNGSNKRMRTGGSDFDMCMEKLQGWVGKARMMYAEKDQACAQSSVNQQLLIQELHKREATNQQLQATIQCLQQKRQSEVYRYERELHLMTDLLDGYRKALKETRRAFAEYRELAPFPQLDGPLYKDVSGGGGLVLSTRELEKRRLKQEEEERGNILLIEKIFKDFEAECGATFEAHKSAVGLLNNRLLDVENQIGPLREFACKTKRF